MYTFEDRGGRSITLRPEGTVGALRSIIEHGLDRSALPVKVFYCGPFFRAERPQAGRYRQFYSLGIEAVGSDDPALDAEVIALAYEGFYGIGLRKFRLDITSLGDADSRKAHRVDLLAYIEKMNLDDATRARAGINPLRLFDDKRPEISSLMAKAPRLLDYLSEESSEHFKKVQGYLSAMGIPFSINPLMVRGLDYYTGTTFEFVHEDLGAQSGIGGGGRYDGLMENIGGQNISGIGFGLGIDRALLAAEAEGILESHHVSPLLYLIPLGEKAKNEALKLSHHIRNAGLTVEVSMGDKALKNAMKSADKSGAIYTCVLGDSELESGNVELKEMISGNATSVTLSALLSTLQLKFLKK